MPTTERHYLERPSLLMLAADQQQLGLALKPVDSPEPMAERTFEVGPSWDVD